MMVQVDRVAGRLRETLRAALRVFPAEHRGGSALARLTGVERTTCQRVTAAMQKAATNEEFLARLPGARGLEAFSAGLRRAGVDEADVVAIESAARDFSRLIASSAGSKLAFDRMVSTGESAQARTPGAPVSPSLFARAREDHFWSACSIAGRWSDLGVTVQVWGPAPDDPHLLETGSARGHFGHSARPMAIPLAFHGGSVAWGEDADSEPGATSDFVPLDEPHDKAARASLGLIESMTTKPLPELTARRGPHMLTYAIDPADLGVAAPIDIVVARRSSTPITHPATDDDPVAHLIAEVDYPMRRFIFDCFLHKSMAMSSVATLSTHIFGSFLDPGPNAWLTRLPFGPRLQVLGPWSTIARGEDDAPALEMAQYLFDALEWDSKHFVGYRCEVAYPVWRASHMIKIDYGSIREPRSPSSRPVHGLT